MKLLRDQFKSMEKSYLKPFNKGCSNKDKKQNLNYSSKNDNYNSCINNSNLFNPNLQGSYNSNNQLNNKNINNGSSNSVQNYLMRDNLNDPFFEDYTNIKMLWDDLGVTDNYKLIFESLSKDIDPIMKQDLFEHEFASLRNFSELLIVN